MSTLCIKYIYYIKLHEQTGGSYNKPTNDIVPGES